MLTGKEVTLLYETLLANQWMDQVVRVDLKLSRRRCPGVVKADRDRAEGRESGGPVIASDDPRRGAFARHTCGDSSKSGSDGDVREVEYVGGEISSSMELPIG